MKHEIGRVRCAGAGPRGRLDKSDERKLDEYLESVSGMEKRVQADLAAKDTPTVVLDEKRLTLNADPYNGKQQTDYIDTMFELIHLAL